MKSRVLVLGIVALAAIAAQAQTKSVIDYKPVSCMRGGELPVLQMNVDGKGELRAYFRRINTTDWCSVEGVNDGPLSRIVLPKFDSGDEIEYFIVLIDGRRVVARSPRIYRSRITSDCETAWARHINKISLSCGEDETGIPSALGAGYSFKKQVVTQVPPFSTPDRPN
ncbi:MAG: hypothetical protein DMF56_20355 [Acidobacteria bacterium]|nr:MAG: hypothetical protein DMF56_20355 [Acidobacteriota bacterium]